MILMTTTNKCHKILVMDSCKELRLYAQLSAYYFVYHSKLSTKFGIPPKWDTYLPIYILNLQLCLSLYIHQYTNAYHHPPHHVDWAYDSKCIINFDIFILQRLTFWCGLHNNMYLVNKLFNPLTWLHIGNFHCNFLSIWEIPIIYRTKSSWTKEISEIICGLYHLS